MVIMKSPYVEKADICILLAGEETSGNGYKHHALFARGFWLASAGNGTLDSIWTSGVKLAELILCSSDTLGTLGN